MAADPNGAPLYAQPTRRIKTDRRDGRALAESCQLGAYRAAMERDASAVPARSRPTLSLCRGR